MSEIDKANGLVSFTDLLMDLKFDYQSVCDFVHAEKLSFKKAWRLANAIVRRSRGGEPSGQNIKVGSKLSG